MKSNPSARPAEAHNVGATYEGFDTSAGSHLTKTVCFGSPTNQVTVMVPCMMP